MVDVPLPQHPFSILNTEKTPISSHSSEIESLFSSLHLRETLQNVPYFLNKKTHIVFCLFFISYLFLYEKKAGAQAKKNYFSGKIF